MGAAAERKGPSAFTALALAVAPLLLVVVLPLLLVRQAPPLPVSVSVPVSQSQSQSQSQSLSGGMEWVFEATPYKSPSDPHTHRTLVRVLGEGGGEGLSFAQVLTRMSADDATGAHFRSSFTNEMLRLVGGGEVFWECRPTSGRRLGEDAFEMLVVRESGERGGLTRAARNPDPATFAKQFAEAPASARFATFSNLGRDAVLVSPLPRTLGSGGRGGHDGTIANYATLASFLRNAPHEDAGELWRSVALAFLNEAGAHPSEPRWLSTSGLGVSWLHVRVDSMPKYYQTKEWKTWA